MSRTIAIALGSHRRIPWARDSRRPRRFAAACPDPWYGRRLFGGSAGRTGRRVGVLRIPREKASLLVVAAFIAVTVAYLAQVTGVVLKGYEIRALEERIETLRRETRQLELELAGQQAMANIAERVPELGMVPVTDARYVKIVGSEVAIK